MRCLMRLTSSIFSTIVLLNIGAVNLVLDTFISSVIFPLQAQAKTTTILSDLSEQKSQPKEVDPTKLRQKMRVRLMRMVNGKRVYAPGTSAGIPSAFGANWGDFYVAIAGATADRVRPVIDGGISTSLGLGNATDIFGLELNYNNLSMRRFATNGSFNAKIHRSIYSTPSTYIAGAVGWNNFAKYGSDTAHTSSSVYGIVSAYHFLKTNPANPLPINLSLGVGGAPLFSNAGVGLIAGAGIQVHPNIGISTAWSGRGLNLAASYLPMRTLPLTLSVVYGDVLNNTEAGSVLSFSIGYGFDFTP